ncbi:hypothetical protein PIB30_050202 [Stylosanthes scabra]|uniref:Uncharacterized protein n=1 Tax=Stylosanthes scabra TaxID=79078 RepID=A0ABU6UKX1_9FABA|nr:hypothetical protein [Stylosanthes scabra]
MHEENTKNRAKQTYTHVGGSKSLARRTEEEEIRHDRHFSRGQMWTIVHRRKDGSYDDARSIGEAIADIESQDESTNELSQNDSLAQVLGKEYSGRVRSVGPGPCPTKLFGSTSQQSSYGRQIEEYQKEIIELKAEAAEEKKKSQRIVNLLRFLVQRQGDDLPPEIGSEMNALGSRPADSHTTPSHDNPDHLLPP